MSMFCKIVGPSSDIHKLPEIPKTFKELHAVVLKKFGHEVSDKFSLKYKDSDDELITICNDDDIETAILTTQSENQKTLRILVLPDTSSQGTQEDKARSFQIQVSPPKTESSERPSLFGKDQFAEEPYIGQLDYISSDPGKLADESGDLRKIIEQLPSTLDFRRSMSHNPQAEPARFQENQDNGRYFDGREIFDKVPHRHGSPGIPEDILNNGFFNEDQMKVIVGIVEQKVAEKIDEKISNFSNEIIAKFQDEVRTMGIGRGGTNFSFKGMPMPYGSRVGLRRNKETQESDQPKDCSNCNKRIAGIKYNCLTCRDFTCCEDCENIINHEHPLLKIRPGKANETAKAENAVEKEDNTDFMQNMTTSTRFQPRASENTNMNSSININQQQDTIQPTIYQERKRVNMENMSSSASWGAGRIDSGMIQPSGRLSTQVYANKDSNSYNPRRIEASGQGSRVLFKSSTMDLQSPTHFVSPNVKSNPRGSEFKQYKVALVKPPLYEVTTVKAGHHYNINFTIKNNGELKWPDDTKLICIDGVHKGDEFGLPALNPGNTYIVDLHLQAPWELGRFFNEWKVHYTKDGAPKSFGKEISIEIEVVDGDKMDKDRAKREKVEKPEKTPQIDIDRESRGSLQGNKNLLADDDKKLMKEFECSEQILKHAKVLQDLVCTGSLKEKVEFIKNCSSEWSLNQIVSAYLNTPAKLKNVAGGNPTPQ